MGGAVLNLTAGGIAARAARPLKGQASATAMAKVDVGDKAPGFELPDHTGTPRTLEEFLGAPLVLYFYPGDFTPFCTREACHFQDAMGDLGDLGAQVVGISDDPPGKHAKFRKANDLTFPLLSDEGGEVIEAYGCDGLIKTSRVTFLIDEDGRVAERITGLLPGTHIRKALDALEETQGSQGRRQG